MKADRIPEIRDLSDSAKQGIGQEVRIGIHSNDPETGSRILTPAASMIDTVIADVFLQEDIKPDERLADVCGLVARVALGRIATAKGFIISYGDPYKPNKVVRVDIEPRMTIEVQANVTHIATGNE